MLDRDCDILKDREDIDFGNRKILRERKRTKIFRHQEKRNKGIQMEILNTEKRIRITETN